MTSNGLRTQYPYQGDALSPRPLYDFPSPTSNYPSSVGGGVSPGVINGMAFPATPSYGSSAFIPPADVFLEGRQGSVQDQNTTNGGPRKRSSEALNSDPVAMHLLVETAIGDSQYFDILSVEEVEALKQEQKRLDARLGPVRKKLMSESKIRDAALSLTRLTSQKGKNHTRGIGSRGSNAVNTSSKSEDELQASNQKIEGLTRELFEIENRMRIIEQRLLMHTAGVLQFTHNGPSKRNQNSQLPNGVDKRPDSPASIYTYETNGGARAKSEDFDERSLYRSPENLDSLMNALHNGTHHHSVSMNQQSQALDAVEKRLEDFNNRLRDLIIQANPERNQNYAEPPRMSGDSADAKDVDQQLDFLEQGLQEISSAQKDLDSKSRQSLNEVEGRLEGINSQMYAMLSKTDEDVQPPPVVSSGGSKEQLDYLENSFYRIQQRQQLLSGDVEGLREELRFMSTSMDEMEEERSMASNDQIRQYETTLMGLWQIIQAGEEEARRRKQERRELLATQADPDEELSADEDYNPNEEYTLNAFSAKVQWLYRRASSLRENKIILMRQIKQQRELNSRSDAQKEAEFARLHEEVEAARMEKGSVERELERAVGQLKQFDEEHVANNESSSRELREFQDRSAGLKAELEKATAEKEAAEVQSSEARKALNAKEEELQEIEAKFINATTELTIAKAELDGAYGSRAERAAEAKVNPEITKELESLKAQNTELSTQIEGLRKAQDTASESEAQARDAERNLKQELAAMASEYEALTRDSIQNEKDRDSLEALIDALRDEKESLEMEMSDERVKWLGVRSPGIPNSQPQIEATSIRMLREDFRKMMRDRTAEGLKALRHEQEERRKLEALVRTLRKEAGPQRSNLNKTMIA